MTFIRIFEYYSFPQNYRIEYSLQIFGEQYSIIRIIQIFVTTLFLKEVLPGSIKISPRLED